MSEPKTIHVVATSDYDAPIVLGAYSSRELANIANERFDDCQITEVTIDKLPEVPEGKLPWNVRLTEDDGQLMDKQAIWRTSCLHFEEAGPSKPYCGGCYYQVWAATPEEALARAKERYRASKS